MAVQLLQEYTSLLQKLVVLISPSTITKTHATALAAIVNKELLWGVARHGLHSLLHPVSPLFMLVLTNLLSTYQLLQKSGSLSQTNMVGSELMPALASFPYHRVAVLCHAYQPTAVRSSVLFGI